MFEKFILQEIKDNFDWEEYLQEHYSIKHTSRGELRICCPKCVDQKYKCYVNNDKKVFHCFRCNFTSRKYSLFDFVAETEDITRFEAMKKLYNEYRRTTPEYTQILSLYEDDEEDEAPPAVRTKDIPKEAVKIKLDDPSHKPFVTYLKEVRGLTEDEITNYNTHCVPSKEGTCPVYNSTDKFVGDIGRRVLWPVYGGDHDVIGWLARTTDKNYSRKDKYLNSPDSEFAKTLYPYVKPKGDTAVLVEGLIDAISVRRVPGVNAYASFGKHLSQHQILLLQSWGIKNLIIFYDPDAIAEISRTVENTKDSFNNVYVLKQDFFIKNNKDAGDCLLLSNGSDIIKDALRDCIHYNSLEYLEWEIKAKQKMLL